MLMLSALAALVLSPSPAQARVDAWFSRDVRTAELGVAEFAEARKGADLVLPDLRDEWLVNGLRGLAKSGRTVRIVLSAAQEDGLTTWECLSCIALEADGAEIRYVRNRIAERFAVIDGPSGRRDPGDDARVLVMTGRLDVAGDGSMLRLAHEGDEALAFQSEFDRLWMNGRDYQAKAPHAAVATHRDPPAPAVIFAAMQAGDKKTFTPMGDAALPLVSYLTGAIDHTYDTVDIAARAVRRTEVFNALVRAAGRGVRVRILVEGRELGPTPSAEDCRKAANNELTSELFLPCMATRGVAEVRYAFSSSGKSARLQSTYAVIDRKKALVGGPETSGGKMADQGFAALTVVRGAAAVAYAAQFERGFGQARQPLKALAQESEKGTDLCKRLRTVAARSGDTMEQLKAHLAQESCD